VKLPRKIFIEILGCPKNLVDSEFLAFSLEKEGFDLVEDEKEAEGIVITTCGFISSAEEESYERIREAIRRKKKGEIEFVAVGGCLIERRGELSKKFKGVDIFFKLEDFSKLGLILKGERREDVVGERKILTPFPYAYVKISEGCDRKCTFCTIPKIRGKHISRPIEVIVEEVRKIVSLGRKEIILVSQDSSLYGYDLYGRYELPNLMRKLLEIGGVEIIRVMYLNPVGVNRDFISVLKDAGEKIPYLHIPIQHSSGKILELMGRPGGADGVRRAIEGLREEVRVGIRTEIMVGFPYEDDKDFDELLRFLEKYKFERIAVFKYEKEDGTEAFYFPQIDEDKKNERFEIATTFAHSEMERQQEKLLNREIEVIIDEVKPYLKGRTIYDAPLVDLSAKIIGKKEGLREGDIIRATVKSVEDLDLLVEPLS